MINQLDVWISAPDPDDDAESSDLLSDEEDGGVLPRAIKAILKIIAEIFRVLVHKDTIQFYR